MLTIDALRQFGADTKDGLGRCMNNEGFYLRLVSLSLDDAGFEKLSSAVRNGDKKAAFEAAHALKGVLGNLALTPLYASASEITELLRVNADADYAALVEKLLRQREALTALREG
ncbi:MAG: Hpt domain-containing protein [Oscillospiraceae bacterium]|nr:Hpt domain-containing protein [Oscillospiraceae bacterium]